MSKPKKFHCRSEAQKKAIRRNYAKRAEEEKRAETYPHFRHYLKSGHPALIVDEIEPDEYKYRKVTHSEREGRHLNEKVYPNPDPADDAPMYIVKRPRHDKKKYFGKKYPWKYPPKKWQDKTAPHGLLPIHEFPKENVLFVSLLYTEILCLSSKTVCVTGVDDRSERPSSTTGVNKLRRTARQRSKQCENC